VIVNPEPESVRIADAKTTFADAFVIADRGGFCSGVSCITDLIVKERPDQSRFRRRQIGHAWHGRAMMGTGEAFGRKAGR